MIINAPTNLSRFAAISWRGLELQRIANPGYISWSKHVKANALELVIWSRAKLREAVLMHSGALS